MAGQPPNWTNGESGIRAHARPRAWQLLWERGLIVLVSAAFLPVCSTGFMKEASAQEQLVDCHAISCTEDYSLERSLCNARVLRALAEVDTSIAERILFGSGARMGMLIALQQERQWRLREFHAPECPADQRSAQPTPTSQHQPPRAAPSQSFLRRLWGESMQPLWTRGVEEVGDLQVLLEGQWEGWQELVDRRATRIAFHILHVQQSPHKPGDGRVVRACSDQGKILGRVKNGVLELSRSEPLAMGYSLRLWRSGAPHYRDLEGVALLEVRSGERSGQLVVAGPVWLSRAPKHYPTYALATDYSCEDRALEEDRARLPGDWHKPVKPGS